MTNERFSRQADIVPRERILECKATVIGVGAIGRQVATQLTAIGVPWLKLIDFDVVEESNIASQGYYADDLNLSDNRLACFIVLFFIFNILQIF